MVVLVQIRNAHTPPGVREPHHFVVAAPPVPIYHGGVPAGPPCDCDK